MLLNKKTLKKNGDMQVGVWFDISWPIVPGMTEYKNRKTVSFIEKKTFKADDVRESIITIGTHTGTHIDAPAHFLEKGKTMGEFEMKPITGPCAVLDLSSTNEAITEHDLAPYVDYIKGFRVLLKTKNSARAYNEPFDAQFVYLSHGGAQFLMEHQAAAVGIDYLGIEHSQQGHPTHKTLLGADIPIVEGLRLQHVSEGEYFLVCVPLSVPTLEAAPARALLWTS